MGILDRLRLRTSGFRRSQSGSTAVEFGVLALLYFLIVFAIIEIALLFTAELVLDKGTTYAGRMVRVGRAQHDNMTKEQFAAFTCDKVKIMLDCNKLVFDIRSYPSFADVPDDVPMKGDAIDTSGFKYELSRGGTIVALRVFYKWPILTSVLRRFFADTNDGSVVLMSMSTFRTEPF
ncbi:TadE/TadG family type IV pilus assembly protein [Aureimonas sp. AU20]|uniref:TadE/TadG family type IV pilus assembly protein n=1 Tax=Aureimonas sp. AU20 TaxID=1349819 RepID=UPI0007225175|nr:TadE/TadG family type IV pilus assembly protein [Aureimonas sp. AU20]ALN75301.1 hypothetical protein M673_21435 [Aureimonas sp. AU20]